MKRLVALVVALILIAAIVYGLNLLPVTARDAGLVMDQQNSLPLLIKVVPSPTATEPPPIIITPCPPMPVCTAPVCQEDEVLYYPPGCPEPPYLCGMCATVTPMPFCTPPACGQDEVYYCPGDCPGGCGTTCATVTPAARPSG